MTDVVGIARETLETALASAEDLDPEKFVAHLRSVPAPELDIEQDGGNGGVDGEDAPLYDGDVDVDGEVLTEVVYVPESKPADVFRVLGVDVLPRSSSIVGTVASNPDGGEPTSEDYTRFANRGRVHVMLYPPYDSDCWRAYTSDGEQRPLEVYDVEFPEEEDEGSWLKFG